MPQSAPQTTSFGRYNLIGRIAQGGMGEIYLAQFSGVANFKKRCIIKKILPELASSPTFVEKFLQEGRTLVNLTHSNIVQVFDMGSVNGEYYIAMEHVAGADLRFLLRHSDLQAQPLPIEVCAYVIMEVLNGLSYAHSAVDDTGRSLNIIHRDISTSNLLISESGEVKIIDFGIAKTEHQMVESISGIVQGKFAYMSPEQARGETLDQRTDLFSCGVVFYEMLTGLRPFEANSDLQSLERIKTEKCRPVSELRADADADLDAIIAKALAKNRDDRYASTDAFYDALEHYLSIKQFSVNARDLTAAFKRALKPDERQLVHSGTDLFDAAFASLLMAQSNEDAGYFTKSLILTDSFSREVPKAGPEDFAIHAPNTFELNDTLSKAQGSKEADLEASKTASEPSFRPISITAEEAVAVAFWKKKARVSNFVLALVLLFLLIGGLYLFHKNASQTDEQRQSRTEANSANAPLLASGNTAVVYPEDAANTNAQLPIIFRISQTFKNALAQETIETIETLEREAAISLAKAQSTRSNTSAENSAGEDHAKLSIAPTNSNNKGRERVKPESDTPESTSISSKIKAKANREAFLTFNGQKLSLPSEVSIASGQDWNVTPVVSGRYIAISKTGKYEQDQEISAQFCELIVRISESFVPNDPSPYQIADIYIDGVLYARKSDTASFVLPCGNHEIQAKYDDTHISLEARATIQAVIGDTTTIALKLKVLQ